MFHFDLNDGFMSEWKFWWLMFIGGLLMVGRGGVMFVWDGDRLFF